MEVKLDLKDAADWVYRGEGAVNLVLAYTGTSPAFVRLHAIIFFPYDFKS